ncbi:MAG: hypothetical protein ABIN91_18650 [Mucilaginibacter sp.]|uniref:hypothetical protein n=1 Tax=Mucilaginibacter sp. TaxID=1882438 RepID=UPI0032646A5A
MDTINWANYNFNDFTEFCNALLTFEVSKRVKPFSASGRDGGIDASYYGGYDDLVGTWRFQFKFHKVARKQGFHLLKNQLISETKQLKGEDFFVLMTNVELLPQEQQELESSFETEKTTFAPNAKLLIWDGAKLQTLILRHPLLSLWMDEGFETAQLQDYRTFFKKGIEATQFVPYTLSNIFIGRDNKIAELKGFLNSNMNIALIEGEAGIGKTRLVIEFFKQEDTSTTKWSSLVLANKNVDFDKLRKALLSEGSYVVLIDDAHSYDAKDVADLKKLADIFKGKVKLILTARSLEASNSLQQIREYDQSDILKLNLSTLERLETQAAFEPYIVGGRYWHHIGDLINITYGRPVLIVAVLRAIMENTRIETIRETDFLKNYVNNYFGEFHSAFTKSTAISDFRSRRLLQNIALIEPFSFDDHHIAVKLSRIHEIPLPEINLGFKLLKEYSFVAGRYEQSIKPDYYSDIILQGIDASDASEYIMDFGAQLDNIVINLSSVDDVGSDKGALLNSILGRYVGWIAEIEDGPGINSETKISIISRILNTISRIVYVKPKIAQQAVELYLANLVKSDHPVRLEFDTVLNSSYPLTDTLMNKVITILSRLLLLPESYSFVYANSFKLYEITKDKKLFTIYNFTRRDVIDHFALVRQRYVIQRLKQKPDINDTNYVFIRDILKAMLALDFTTSELSPVARDAFSITTFMLPASENVHTFRIEITDLLISFYELPALAGSKLETLKLILDVPRGIFATHRNSRPYENEAEITTVLNFLENYGEGFGLMEQKEVLDKLFWFVKWGVSENHMHQIEQIKDKLKPKDLTERLSQLFSSAEVSLLRNPNIHVYVAEQCDLIATNYSKEDLAEAMRKFLEPQPYPPHYFWEFLRHLERNHTEYALYFHDYLFDLRSPLYYQYAIGILSTLHFEKNEQSFYWTRVHQLETLDNWQADNVILLTYGTRVPGTAKLLAEDAETILRIEAKGRQENNHALAGGLQTLIAVDHTDTNKVIAGYLDRAHQRDAEMFFIWLADNKTASNELIRSLVLKNTVRFYLSYEIERSLIRVLKNYGTQVVFDYLVSRFNYKKDMVMATRSLMGYDFLPSGEHSHLFEENPYQKMEMFEMALSWYLEVDGTGGHLFYGKDMLVYLQPGQAITNETYLLYDKMIAKYSTKLDSLERVAETLSIFHTKDPLMVALVIKIYSLAVELKEADLEMFGHINYALQSALTSVGVKSGKAGEPFQVDLDLHDLLTKEINQLPDYIEAKQFLNGVLKAVNYEIDRNLDHDNETW